MIFAEILKFIEIIVKSLWNLTLVCFCGDNQRFFLPELWCCVAVNVGFSAFILFVQFFVSFCLIKY